MTCLVAAALPATRGVGQETPGAGPYLAGSAIPDGLAIVPPPPRRGSAADRADRQVYKKTRKLIGTPRWRLAQADVTSDWHDHFACALGGRLTPQSAPALARLLDRASTAGVVDPVKRRWQVPRPYLRFGGRICQPRTAHLDSNGDYPSGHAAGGWMEALILAELVPERATQILARGRAFGESRWICGAHSRSAVEAGWLAGAATTAALHGSPEFRRDLEQARREWLSLRITAPAADAGTCAAETATLAATTPSHWVTAGHR